MLFLSSGGKEVKPSGDDCLDACFQLDHSNGSVLVKKGRLDVKHVWPPSKAIGLIFVVECVKNFHCRITCLVATQSTSLER